MYTVSLDESCLLDIRRDQYQDQPFLHFAFRDQYLEITNNISAEVVLEASARQTRLNLEITNHQGPSCLKELRSSNHYFLGTSRKQARKNEETRNKQENNKEEEGSGTKFVEIINKNNKKKYFFFLFIFLIDKRKIIDEFDQSFHFVILQVTSEHK